MSTTSRARRVRSRRQRRAPALTATASTPVRRTCTPAPSSFRRDRQHGWPARRSAREPAALRQRAPKYRAPRQSPYARPHRFVQVCLSSFAHLGNSCSTCVNSIVVLPHTDVGFFAARGPNESEQPLIPVGWNELLEQAVPTDCQIYEKERHSLRTISLRRGVQLARHSTRRYSRPAPYRDLDPDPLHRRCLRSFRVARLSPRALLR
jgi:hypothetical protein